MPRILLPEGGTAVLVVEMDEMPEHLHEGAALTRLERRQNKALRGRNRRLEEIGRAHV